MTGDPDAPKPPEALPAYVVEPLRRQDRTALEHVREYVEALIEYETALERADVETDELADTDEELLDVEEAADGTRVVKKVPCGKDNCSTCPHGPYEYRDRRDGETLHWEYVGSVDE